MVTVYERLQQIVKEKGWQQIKFPDLVIVDAEGATQEELEEEINAQDGMIVDMQTANVVIQVIKALSPENQIKAKKMLETWKGFDKMVNFAWKCVK